MEKKNNKNFLSLNPLQRFVHQRHFKWHFFCQHWNILLQPGSISCRFLCTWKLEFHELVKHCWFLSYFKINFCRVERYFYLLSLSKFRSPLNSAYFFGLNGLSTYVSFRACSFLGVNGNLSPLPRTPTPFFISHILSLVISISHFQLQKLYFISCFSLSFLYSVPRYLLIPVLTFTSAVENSSQFFATNCVFQLSNNYLCSAINGFSKYTFDSCSFLGLSSSTTNFLGKSKLADRTVITKLFNWLPIISLPSTILFCFRVEN